MADTAPTVKAGRAAWARLRADQRRSWRDWAIVGKALLVGRAAAMQQAKTNAPIGSRYNSAMANGYRTTSRWCVNSTAR